jgi:hypothetical protein
MEVREENGAIYIDNLVFGGYAEAQKLDFDWQVTRFQLETERPAKEWFFIPAFLLAFAIMKIQKGRREEDEAKGNATANLG